MWILKNKKRILYNMVSINANFNMKGTNGSEKFYSKNKMEVKVFMLSTVQKFPA
jgi:hypothetical protein